MTRRKPGTGENQGENQGRRKPGRKPGTDHGFRDLAVESVGLGLLVLVLTSAFVLKRCGSLPLAAPCARFPEYPTNRLHCPRNSDDPNADIVASVNGQVVQFQPSRGPSRTGFQGQPAWIACRRDRCWRSDDGTLPVVRDAQGGLHPLPLPPRREPPRLTLLVGPDRDPSAPLQVRDRQTAQFQVLVCNTGGRAGLLAASGRARRLSGALPVLPPAAGHATRPRRRSDPDGPGLLRRR